MNISTIIFIVIISLVIISLLIMSMDNKTHKTKECKLHKLSAAGPTPVKDGINHYRPLLKVSDYMGIIKIRSDYDYILKVSSPSYYEICVYEYPSYKIVYSETDIKELHLGFLPNGNYSIIIHSIEKVKGELTQVLKKKVKRPRSRLHKVGTSDLYKYVGNMYNDIINLQSEKGLRPINKEYTSNKINSWPKMVHTRIENLKFTPEGSEAIIICVDKHLLKVSGSNKPKIIAQYDNLCAYSIPSGYTYNITHIHSDIDKEDEHLPFYVYCFDN